MKRLFSLCFILFILKCNFYVGKGIEIGIPHSDNWVVLVSTSKYWLNYRHIANVLTFYQEIKRMGIPDSNIIIMMAEDIACNPRNPFPGEVFSERTKSSWSEENAGNIACLGSNFDIEVDYRGRDVTVENFLRVLTGRHLPHTPRQRRMFSSSDSNVLVYLSGHGGDGFLKFQDVEELSTSDLTESIRVMHRFGRFGHLAVLIDTCEASTLVADVDTPRTLVMASSVKDEKSLSHTTDLDIGMPLSDRFTMVLLDFIRRKGARVVSESDRQIHAGSKRNSKLNSEKNVHISSVVEPSDTVRLINATIQDLVQEMTYGKLGSTFYHREIGLSLGLDRILVSDFFGSKSKLRNIGDLRDEEVGTRRQVKRRRTVKMTDGIEKGNHLGNVLPQAKKSIDSIASLGNSDSVLLDFGFN